MFSAPESVIRTWAAAKCYAPADSILMVVAAVIYFLSPFDLIPDAIPVFGLIDDAAVSGSAARANLTAISNFRKWEILFSGEFPFAWHCKELRTQQVDAHHPIS